MRQLRAYKKTVSIVKETSVGLYENFVGKIMDVIQFLEKSQKKLLLLREIVL